MKCTCPHCRKMFDMDELIVDTEDEQVDEFAMFEDEKEGK